MEQIVRLNGTLYYGDRICRNADDAYRLYREDYHRRLGRRVFKRLNYPDRLERVHGFHVYYTDDMRRRLESEFSLVDVGIPCRILGISGISYCYAFSLQDCPDYEEEKFYRWIDWALMNYGSVLKLVGRNTRSGRTSKRNKITHR